MINALQGNLINIFKKIDVIETLEEFIEADIPLMPFSAEVLQYLLKNHKSKNLAEKVKKALRLTGFKTDRNFLITNYDNLTDNGFAILTTMSMAKKKISDNLKKKGSLSLFPLDIVRTHSTDMVFIMNKQLKFLWQFNHKILRLISSNFLVKWYDETVDVEHVYDRFKKFDINQRTDDHPLTVNDLHLGFDILKFGLLLSFIIFVFEMGKYLKAKMMLFLRTV